MRDIVRPMAAFGMTLALRDDPEAVAAYVDAHRNAWPHVKQRLREVGISSMLIFLRGRRLFMCFEAPDGFDPSEGFAVLLDDPTYVEWDLQMRALQEPAPEALPGEWWAPMEMVFDLAWPDSASSGAGGDS
jgi:L-rhamnose mutarotase